MHYRDFIKLMVLCNTASCCADLPASKAFAFQGKDAVFHQIAPQKATKPIVEEPLDLSVKKEKKSKTSCSIKQHMYRDNPQRCYAKQLRHVATLCALSPLTVSSYIIRGFPSKHKRHLEEIKRILPRKDIFIKQSAPASKREVLHTLEKAHAREKYVSPHILPALPNKKYIFILPTVPFNVFSKCMQMPCVDNRNR